MAKKGSKKVESNKPKVHDDLKGLDIRINELGEIETSYDIRKLNEFLNRNTDDKKLKQHTQKKSGESDSTE